MITCNSPSLYIRSLEDRNAKSDIDHYTYMSPAGFGKLFQVISPRANLKQLPTYINVVTKLFEFHLLNYSSFNLSVNSDGAIEADGQLSKLLRLFDGYVIAYPIKFRRNREFKNIIVVEFIKKGAVAPETRIFIAKVNSEGFIRREMSKEEPFELVEGLANEHLQINFHLPSSFFGIPKQFSEIKKRPFSVMPRMFSKRLNVENCYVTKYKIHNSSFFIFNYCNSFRDKISVDVNCRLRLKYMFTISQLNTVDTNVVVFPILNQEAVCIETEVNSQFRNRFFIIQITNKHYEIYDSVRLASRLARGKNLRRIQKEIRQQLVYDKVFITLLMSNMFDEDSLSSWLPRDLIRFIGSIYRCITE